MSKENLTNARTSVALTRSTIAKLKTVAVANKLQMYEFVATMVDLATADEVFLDQVIARTKAKQSAKYKGSTDFIKNVAKLPDELRDKLKTMPVEELEKLLKGEK